MANVTKANFIKVISMERESIIISKDNYILAIGKIMLRRALVSIFMKMEPDTQANFKTI